MSVKVTNNIKRFVAQNASAMDRSLNKMAVDIERLSKEQVPFRNGQLKASGKHLKRGFLKWQVEYDTVYARYQEFGGDARRVIRNYTLPGKKSFYLRDPGDLISRRAVQYFLQEAKTISI